MMALLDELYGGQGAAVDPQQMQMLLQRLAQLQGQGGATVSTPERAAQQPLRVDVGQPPQPDGVAEARSLNQGILDRAKAAQAAETQPVRQMMDQTAAAPVADKIARSTREPDTSEKLGAFLAGLADGNGLLSSIGGGMQASSKLGRQRETENMTRGFLIKNGMDEELADVVSRNSALSVPVIQSMSGKGPPQIIEVPGAYGQNTKMVWDQRARKLVPMSTIMGDQSGAGPVASATAAAQPAQPQEQTTLGTQHGGQAPAERGPVADAPAVAGAANAAAGVPAATPAAQAQANAEHIVGQAVPKAPEGYMHKMAPNGAGYLWDAKTKQPIFESKAESDARAKGTEKRELERVDKEQEIGGVAQIVNDARRLTEMPAFDKGMMMSRWRTELPYIGAVNPVTGINRIVDAQDPANTTSDDIGTLQARMNLIAGRAYLKGQGQVSNFERQMVSDAIGSLASATSKADFQFRLNSVERLLKAMDTGRKGAVTEANGVTMRPAEYEITSAINPSGPNGVAQFRDGAVAALAKKYNVAERDMQEYLNNLYKRGR